MRPSLKNFGGHIAFAKYRDCFRSLYCNPENPVRDMMNRLVLFDQDSALDDCAHICYGGTAGANRNPDSWDEKRAERIEWIGLALKTATVVHPDKNGPGRQKYLLYLPAADGFEEEFYCVIVRVVSKRVVAFLTAYYVTEKKWNEYASVGPRIYPLPKPPTNKKKRAKKLRS